MAEDQKEDKPIFVEGLGDLFSWWDLRPYLSRID
jgi:hypothetical protein